MTVCFASVFKTDYCQRPFWERGDRHRRWVRVYFTWKCEEIGEFVAAPHPAYSATFSRMEKAKYLYCFAHFGKYIFVNEINSLKTIVQLGEGGPRQWWVRV